MTGEHLPFRRVFSMPAFEALRQLLIYRENRPEAALEELIGLIQTVEPDAAALDIEAALVLIKSDRGYRFKGGQIFYRDCIASALLSHQPGWLRVITQGRTRFVKELDRDEYSIFRQAGLLVELPDEQVVSWWDDVTGLVRMDSELEKMLRARRAERLSIQHETAKLTELGINLTPQWKGLDDNFAGYDVLSYAPGVPTPTNPDNPSPTNLLIEVKSTIASPLRFILTRNEWETAKDKGEAYLFHVWDLTQNLPNLHVRNVAQIAVHIPADNEKGRWKSVEIPIGGG